MSTWDQVKETTKGLVKMIPDPIPDNGRIIIGEYKISTDVTSIRIKKEIESIIVFYAGTWKEIRYLHALAIWEDGVRKSITPKRISFCNQRYGIYPGMRQIGYSIICPESASTYRDQHSSGIKFPIGRERYMERKHLRT